MGRARNPHIFKKLARRYFKFDVNRNSYNSVKPLYGSLINAWARYGMDSVEGDLVIDQIDVAVDNDEKQYREAKSLTKKLPYEFNQMFTKIKTKYTERGRNRTTGARYSNITENYLKNYYKDIGIKH